MREVKVAQLCQRLLNAPAGPLLGLDVGTRYIGVAVSDANYQVAQPHSFLEIKGGTSHHVAMKLEKLVHELSVPALVIGYPLRIGGFQGKQGPIVGEFVRELQISERFKDICFVYWDERLTTKTVDVAISFLKLEHRRKKQITDKMAALCILQSCLDNMARHKSHHLLTSLNL